MIRAALIWLALALPVAAQDLPQWKNTSINDFARLLTPEDTMALDQALIALHQDTGVQGTVVTLGDRASFGGTDGLEPFATRLFNNWGVGEAGRNDGFMVLVLRDDREVRIELGDGYPEAMGRGALNIIDRVMRPEFQNGDLSQGIRLGTESVIEHIARPHAAGMGYDGPEENKSPQDWLLSIGVLGIFGFAGFNILRGIWRRVQLGRQPCPNCGGSGLVQESEIIRPSDTSGRASQVMWTRCPRCNWCSPRSAARPVSRSRRSRGRGFGGGRSSGGGASGRW